MSSFVPGVPPEIALLEGPMLLGYLFSYGLFGILTVQLFLYYTSFPRDPLWMKCLVWSLAFIELVITVLQTIAAWKSLAAGWGDLATLERLNWGFAALPALSGLVSCTVQFFFCWRILVLMGNWILPLVIALIGVTQFAFAAYSGVRAFILPLAEISSLNRYVIVWLGGSAIADILITTSMTYVLFRTRSKTVFKESKSLVKRLITLTVETGMTTAAGALVELILFNVFTHNNMHFIAFFMLAKLYSNTLLATLNARSIFANMNSQGYYSGPKGAALWVDEIRSPRQTKASVGSFFTSSRGVHVTTETQRHTETDVELNIISSQTPASPADHFVFMPPKEDGSFHSSRHHPDFDADDSASMRGPGSAT